MSLSPVAFFAFNRPYHTLQTLNSLSMNFEANETDLFVFIDGPRKNSEIHLIDNVEKIIISFTNKFKSLKIFRSEVNLSSAINQKRGISKVLSIYESVINLEDDIYVSKYFLSYMNKALKIYKNMNEIWHVNGFNYPLNLKGEFECFFMRSMQCWGWGTWRDKWNSFIEEPLSCDPYYLKSIFNKKMINEFDLNLKKSIFWSQVEDNASGKLNNTLAIFWYSHIFLNKGLCLTPKISLTRNIGHDGSGMHTLFDKEFLESVINPDEITNFPKIKEENKECLVYIRNYLNRKNNIYSKVIRKLYFLLNFLRKI